MAILKVTRLGHPVLRQVAEIVAPETIDRPEFQQFIDDMIETMHEYEGVGLAAPQVHVSQQVAVLEVTKHPRYPDAPSVPLTVLINPRLTVLAEATVDGWEGCLSIPELRGVVPRYSELRVEALDRHGNLLDFPAKVLAVKTQDAHAALQDLAAAAPRVPVVCMTNGVEAERLALRYTPAVHAACVLLPGTYLVPGVVQSWGSQVPGVFDIGRYPEGRDDVADAIARELAAAGFTADVRADVMRWKRGKMLWNVANAIEALCGRSARYGGLAERARGEAMACFEAAGLAFATAGELDARSAPMRPKPIEGAARAGGSTWQSLARGARSLETDYLNGEIALLGRLHGVATPVNALLQRLASEAARKGLAPGSMTVAELEALARDRSENTA